MAERVGNPVPKEIREQLVRNEVPLVYELVTPPKRADQNAVDSWGAELCDVLRADARHELLLTRNRIVVVATARRQKLGVIALSIPLDVVTGVERAGSGAERGRVRFDFRDASCAHGVMGLLLPRPAERFVAAYEDAHPGRRS